MQLPTRTAVLACALAALMVALATAPADARKQHRSKHRHTHVAKKVTKEKVELPKGTLQIVVSIGDQRIRVYSDGVPFAEGAVSTGKPGHLTPMGVFTVIGKERYHRSNIYSGAPMPFMQRITWSGVAMHAGHLPGYPASHGCIRMHDAFARKLWVYTQKGVRVIVARHDVPPVEISHPLLFVPKLKPVAELRGTVTASAAAKPPAAVKTAETIDPNKATDAPRPEEKAPAVASKPPAPPASEPPKVAPGGLTLHDADKSSAPANAKTAAPAATATEAPKPAEQPVPDAAVPAATAATAAEAPKTAQPPTPAAKAAAKAAEAPKPAEQAAAKPTVPYVGLSPADLAEFKPAEPVIPKGPVSVFVSRKTGKLYVRKGTIPMFESPVVIRDPEKPFGTLVFTAMNLTDGGAGMRWTVQTLPPEQPRATKHHRRHSKKKGRRHQEPEPVPVKQSALPSPREVLDRIDMPVYAVNQISQWLSPGSSLMVSDHAMSGETGNYTDFIVETR